MTDEQRSALEGEFAELTEQSQAARRVLREIEDRKTAIRRLLSKRPRTAEETARHAERLETMKSRVAAMRKKP